MKYLKLSVAVLAGVSLAFACGLVVHVVSGNEIAANVAFFAGGLLATAFLRADI